MTMRVAAYILARLAPGSYDVLLDGGLVAALVREVDSSGSAREWVIDLLDVMPSFDRPTPFTAQRSAFTTLAVALQWLGIRDKLAGGEILNHGRPGVRLRGPEA